MNVIEAPPRHTTALKGDFLLENASIETAETFEGSGGKLTLIGVTFKRKVTFAGHFGPVSISGCFFDGGIEGHIITKSISLHGSNEVLCSHTTETTCHNGSTLKGVFARQADT